MNDPSVTRWLAEAQQGDSLACGKIWQHYFQRLVRLARQRLADRNRGCDDEEDVALSVFNSFFQAAQNGRFPNLVDRDDLWRLLLKMTLRKTVDQFRRHNALKRGGVLNSDEAGHNILPQWEEAVARELTPDLACEIAERMEQLLGRLEKESDRQIAIAKFEGHTNREIAKQLDCSERTVEHRLKLIRVKWSRAIERDGN